MDITKNTAKTYGFLWARNKDISPVDIWHFNALQGAINEPIVRGSLGIEIGSGCGYDTCIMAKKKPLTKIISIDISDSVYGIKKLAADFKNIHLIQSSFLNLPVKDDLFDFAYSFGVLHHISNPVKGLLEITRVLKKGAPAFLYVYEAHTENVAKYIAVKITAIVRKATVRIPSGVLWDLCWLASPFVYILFTFPSKIFKKLKAAKGAACKWPFNFGKGLFSMQGDLYDRFSAPIEHRFTRRQIEGMFIECGFCRVKVNRLVDRAGWAAWGYKGDA